MVDTIPDLELISKGQCFPRYRYEQNKEEKQGKLLDDTHELKRIDNITDATLRKFRIHYNDNKISKDTIFYYVYGVLHAPAYRKRFANDLSKDLPRIPMAPDFHAFAKAGKQLAKLHLNYETCKDYPLEVVHTQLEEPRPEHFRIGHKAMRFARDEKSVLIVNDHIRLEGIPAEAHLYEVNGRTPLGWFIDRYRITKDIHSGIVNDPNGWFNDPEALVKALHRIVHVGVETMAIIASLPHPFSEPMRQGTECSHDR